MDSNPPSRQTSHATSGPAKVEAVEPEHVGHDSLSEDMSKLRRDLANLKDTYLRLASQLGDEAAKTVRSTSQSMASEVGSVTTSAADAASELASATRERAKTFASELETMGRNNPLGTIAGALVVGVIIGLISRGRN